MPDIENEEDEEEEEEELDSDEKNEKDMKGQENSHEMKDNQNLTNYTEQKQNKVDKLSIFKKNSGSSADKEEYHDPIVNNYCHILHRRYTEIDITTLIAIVPCFKLRHKNSLVKFFYNDKNDYIYCPYFVYFDEFMFYFIKDKEVDFYPKEDDRRVFTRYIGKNYNIKKIHKLRIVDHEDKIKITVTFKLHALNQEFVEENYVVKDIYFFEKEADIFLKMLKYFLTRYKIPIKIPETSKVN